MKPIDYYTKISEVNSNINWSKMNNCPLCTNPLYENITNDNDED